MEKIWRASPTPYTHGLNAISYIKIVIKRWTDWKNARNSQRILGVPSIKSIITYKISFRKRDSFQYGTCNLASGQFKSGGGMPSPIDNQDYESFTNWGRRSPSALKLTRCYSRPPPEGLGFAPARRTRTRLKFLRQNVWQHFRKMTISV